jgi:hypothetical protein
MQDTLSRTTLYDTLDANVTGDNTYQGVLPFPRRAEAHALPTVRPIAIGDFEPAVRDLLIDARNWAQHLRHSQVTLKHVLVSWLRGNFDTAPLSALDLTDIEGLSRDIVDQVSAEGMSPSSPTPSLPSAEPQLQVLLFSALAQAYKEGRRVCSLADVAHALFADLAAQRLLGPTADALVSRWPRVRAQNTLATTMAELVAHQTETLPARLENYFQDQIRIMGERLAQHQQQVALALSHEHQELKALALTLGQRLPPPPAPERPRLGFWKRLFAKFRLTAARRP